MIRTRTKQIGTAVIGLVILVAAARGTERIDVKRLLEKRWDMSFFQIAQEMRMYHSEQSTDQRVICQSDRGPVDVLLRRTEAMLKDIASMPGAAEWKPLADKLSELKSRAKDKPKDRALFREICAVRRKIAMSNPLLDFESLIFNGNESASPMFHSQHMSFLTKADPGNSLYRVDDFKNERTAIVADLLEKAQVTNGRFKGQTLSNRNPKWNGRAAVMTPTLSWDGTELMFAWSSYAGSRNWSGRGKFDPPYMFRIFAMGIDGSNLRILADHDGPYDDYDPLYLPGGRLLFVSDRHNGGQRCGNVAVSGNMYTMEPDGDDLYRISWHETNERCPTVDYNGKIVYSRWDYIDRHAYSAQGFWMSYPDGTDPRSYHGNYTEDDKPFHPISECDVMPIPGTTSKYVAIETGHHKSHLGNLVVIDLARRARYEEQIRHFWPGWNMMGDSGHFKEDQRYKLRRRMFRTPVPLSEDYVIVCEFSEILLVDKFRNEILLFDAEPLFDIKVASPIPLKARPVPPAIQPRTYQGKRRAMAPKATIAVMNVYESDFEWPENTRITHLRICQIIGRPKLPWGTKRNVHIGWSDGALIKHVIGTVPVEPDGSAYFEAPIEREIYFQAVDETGMAVQSMLSGTCVHPGEQLSCVGCHEDKWKTPDITRTPMAMQRPPSQITPEVDGSYPLTYHRLAKPVFEENCQGCHRETGKGIRFEYWDTSRIVEDNSGGKGPAVGDLEDYITYYNAAYDKAYAAHEDNVGLFLGKPGNPRSRSIAGQIGARACILLKFLGPHPQGLDIEPDPQHRDVQLTREEFHRVTLWLDMNANELGTYELTDEAYAKQRRGEVVWPEWPGGSGVDPDNPTGVQQVHQSDVAASGPRAAAGD